ncbi:MAG: CotH kinase family protein, partial [Muribaculaceae bacterium]|nr:CotH kinase family protein [Muribaculaceae bacterium]
MAKKIIDEKIDNPDVSWENYRGTRIEEYLKARLASLDNSKAGHFHYDTSNNRYMVFADTASRDLYLENPAEHGELLLATFDAPFNYTAEINLISKQFNPLLAGTTGNYIEFSFDTVNKSGQSVGEDMVCTYTFRRGTITTRVTQKYRAGTTVRFNVDKYLGTGTNTVTIGIVGQNTLAATTVGVTYQMVDLQLTSTLDISEAYEEGTLTIAVPFEISGSGAKVMEWYVDGEQLEYIKSEDEITETATSRTKYIDISTLSAGTHSIQLRAYTMINGERFYSRTIYQEVMIHSDSAKNLLLAIGFTLPLGREPFGPEETPTLSGEQYIPIDLRVAMYDPTWATEQEVGVYLSSELQTTLGLHNGEEATVSLVPMKSGEKSIKLKCGETEREIDLETASSSSSIEEITQGLVLALDARGKSNTMPTRQRASWTYGEVTTIFSGFRWVDTCGWNAGALVMTEGAEITTNFSPLINDVTAGGFTFELEFSARPGSKETGEGEPIIDLRGQSGAGILITASEAMLISAGGATVKTRFKSDERVRLSFVINRKSGSAECRLLYLYVNGILSGAASYGDTDSFLSNTRLSAKATGDAVVKLYQIRAYSMALSASQVLNNYILYRPTSGEFLEVYDRNNIYQEGTTEFSTEALSGQLPILIITGNIPALEATTDKNMQIDVDVEYINLQDPARSFKMTDAALRPQGTSSMSYPKKNFRLYSAKKDSTRVYDADGKEIADRLYAFKSGSQPVDCWCFKADYAESSGTHNTGIARIWNDAMKNAQINGEYRCRTDAQQKAIDNNYGYDVRTTIDGFPILMFYRLTENDPLVFIGKYNFNNDKSTESVFGFRDIPGFDSARMQCWEVLNNGNHLALFTDTENWDKEWSEAFEGRYPDGNTNTGDLKTFAEWMSKVTASEFTTQKWEHLDVYKTAAYYVYLMRFGAVDQVVKNAMFTTEDGKHWYFINYDNDTINGLRNDGLLAFDPTIDRQTLDSSFAEGVYAYAGHDSRLWNMLEADEEFMQIVRQTDEALYSSGLSYANVIRMFDAEQSGKWCERVYNEDSRYKYIGPFTDRGINNLFMLQGSRQSHRRWWLSERFALLDAKWVSGEYKANSFEVKLSGAPAGLGFGIKAGTGMWFGYGVNNVVAESGIRLEAGDSHSFATRQVLNVGDPLRIYAAPYLEEIDVHSMAPYLTQINVAPVSSDRLGTRLRKLTLGDGSTENTALTELSGIGAATALRELDIRGFRWLTQLDLRTLEVLERVNATGAGLTQLSLPKGAPIRELRLPASLQGLTLESLSELTDEGLTLTGNGINLRSVKITECPGIDTHRLVERWMVYGGDDMSEWTLELDGVKWSGVDAAWLLRLGEMRSVRLRGEIDVVISDDYEGAEAQLTALKALFGRNCFSKGSELYLRVPPGVYIIGPTTVRALTTAKYEVLVTGDVSGTTSIEAETAVPTYCTFENGVLTVGDIRNSGSLTLLAKFVSEEGILTIKRLIVNVKSIIYPGSINLTAERTQIVKAGTYEFTAEVTGSDEDAKWHTEWDISGAAVMAGLVEIAEQESTSCKVAVNTLEESSFTIGLRTLRDSDNSQIGYHTISITILVGDILFTSTDNPEIMKICYQQKWAAKSTYMTMAEATAVLNVGSAFNSLKVETFNELQYFINTKAGIDLRDSSAKEVTFPYSDLTDAPAQLRNDRLPKNCVAKYPNLVENKGALIMGSYSADETLEQYETNYSKYGHIVEKLIFPKLKTIMGSGNMLSLNVKSIEIPLLESASAIGNTEISDLSFPALKTLEPSCYVVSGKYTCIGPVSKVEIIDLPMLEELRGSYITCSFYHKTTEDNFLRVLRLPRLKNFSKDLTTPYYTYRRILSGTFNALEVLDLSEMEDIDLDVEAKNLKELTAPKLKILRGRVNCPKLDPSILDQLEEIRCGFSPDWEVWDLEKLTLPKVKKISGPENNLTSNKYSHIFYRFKRLDAPMLEELDTMTFGYPEEVTELNLPSLTTCGSLTGLSSLTELNLPSLTTCGSLTGLSSLTELNLPSLTTCGSLTGLSSLTELNLP